jgi:hypothetical protein
VQRGRVARPAQPHRAADEQRERADARQQEVEDAGTAGIGRHTHVDDVARPQTQHGIAQRLAAVGAVQDAHHVGRVLDGTVVDGNQQVAALDADRGGGRAFGDLGGHHAFGAQRPQHAVFDLAERRARGDVGGAEAQEHRHDEHRERRP